MAHKKTQRKSFKFNIRNALIVVVALVLGFTGGIIYAHYANKPTVLIQQVGPTPHVCSCPMIPAGGNPSDYCHCGE